VAIKNKKISTLDDRFNSIIFDPGTICADIIICTFVLREREGLVVKNRRYRRLDLLSMYILWILYYTIDAHRVDGQDGT